MGWGSDSESSDDEERQNTNKGAHLLVAIDCDEKMFELEGKFSTSTFKAVLKTCYSLLDGQLLKGGKRGGSRIAIVITNEDKEKMTVCNFKDHLPTTLKRLRELCEKSDKELKDLYRRASPMNFGAFILEMKLKFKDVSVQDSTKYLAFVTLDEDPVLSSEDLKFQAVNQAKTLIDFGIQFQLLTFKEDFRYEVFFKEVIFSARSSFRYEYLMDMISLEDKLLSWLSAKGKRTKFYLYPNSSKYIEVIQKTYIKPMKIVNNVKVKRNTLEEVIQLKKNIPPTDKFTVRVNTDTFELSGAERNVFVMNRQPLGYILIGTSSGLLEPGMQSSSPKFLQEDKSTESPHFNLFWKYCVERNKKLICSTKYKVDSASTLVELSATVINNARSFLVQGIPSYNDIHYQDLHNPLHVQPETNDDNIMEAAENLVRTFEFDYDPLKIHDSVTLKKFEYIRAELLEEPLRDVDEIINLKVVDGEEVERVVNDFGKLLTVGKRKTPASGTQKYQKKSKK